MSYEDIYKKLTSKQLKAEHLVVKDEILAAKDLIKNKNKQKKKCGKSWLRKMKIREAFLFDCLYKRKRV
jgi:hypothetical protein